MTIQSVRELSEEKRLAIAEYFRNGTPLKEIAVLYGITIPQVKTTIQTMRNKGVDIPFRFKKRTYKRVHHWDKKDIDRLVEAHKHGIPAKKLAKEFNTTVAAVYTQVADMKKKGLIPKGRRKELLPSLAELEPKKKEDWFPKAVKETLKMEAFQLEKEQVIAQKLLRWKDVTLGEWFKAKVVQLLLWIVK